MTELVHASRSIWVNPGMVPLVVLTPSTFFPIRHSSTVHWNVTLDIVTLDIVSIVQWTVNKCVILGFMIIVPFWIKIAKSDC